MKSAGAKGHVEPLISLVPQFATLIGGILITVSVFLPWSRLNSSSPNPYLPVALFLSLGVLLIIFSIVMAIFTTRSMDTSVPAKVVLALSCIAAFTGILISMLEWSFSLGGAGWNVLSAGIAISVLGSVLAFIVPTAVSRVAEASGEKRRYATIAKCVNCGEETGGSQSYCESCLRRPSEWEVDAPPIRRTAPITTRVETRYTRKCPECGLYNKVGAESCCDCGTSLISKIKCPACGSWEPPTSRYCRKCGCFINYPGQNLTAEEKRYYEQEARKKYNLSTILGICAIVSFALIGLIPTSAFGVIPTWLSNVMRDIGMIACFVTIPCGVLSFVFARQGNRIRKIVPGLRVHATTRIAGPVSLVVAVITSLLFIGAMALTFLFAYMLSK